MWIYSQGLYWPEDQLDLVKVAVQDDPGLLGLLDLLQQRPAISELFFCLTAEGYGRGQSRIENFWQGGGLIKNRVYPTPLKVKRLKNFVKMSFTRWCHLLRVGRGWNILSLSRVYNNVQNFGNKIYFGKFAHKDLFLGGGGRRTMPPFPSPWIRL